MALTHYVDIDVQPDGDFSSPILMSALHSKLHMALVNHGKNNIGISFPGVKVKKTMGQSHLGSRLRLHGDETTLRTFQATTWWKSLSGMVKVGDVCPVPPGVQTYMDVRRVQTKSNPERERRRWQARTGASDEEAQKRFGTAEPKFTNLPFLSVGSKSTRQKFNLFVDHRPVQQAGTGKFNAYGLNVENQGGVPWFTENS